MVITVFSVAGALLAQAASATTGVFTTGTFTTTAGIDLSAHSGVVAAEDEFGAAVTLGSVNFTAGTPDAVTVASAYFNTPQYGGFNYGSSTFPGGLETLMDPVIYNTFLGSTPHSMSGTVGVTIGETYKLQFLFSDQSSVTWDPWTITVEGDSYPATGGFNVASFTGAQGAGTGVGVDITYIYTALDSQLNIVIASQGGADTDGVFLNAFLVTELPEPVSLSLLGLGSLLTLLTLRRTRRSRV